MQTFIYEPSESDLAALTALKSHPGWAVFERIMQQAYSDAAVGGIEELAGDKARPAGWYSGYLASIKETLGRIDFLTEQYRSDVEVAVNAARHMPARGEISPGDTVS